jgi:acyl-coenzyme A thioesterase PaaI-like protein
VKLGGRLAFTEATVVDDAGEVLARAQVTVALSRPTAPGDRPQ